MFEVFVIENCLSMPAEYPQAATWTELFTSYSDARKYADMIKNNAGADLYITVLIVAGTSEIPVEAKARILEVTP